MKTYFVKTRNFNCRRWTFSLLSFTQRSGVQRGDSYTDGDGKFYIETTSPLRAWTIFLFFLALRHFSGGWTYIVLPGHELKSGYQAIN